VIVSAERLSNDAAPSSSLPLPSSVEVVERDQLSSHLDDVVDKQNVALRIDCVTLDEETVNKISDSPGNAMYV